jgi:tetratricopeptide (TPR) repeat protein
MTSDDAAGRVHDGVLLLERGNDAGAEAAFREAIRLDDRCAEAHLHLGWVLLRRDRHLAAGAAFQRAIGLAPGLASAHEGLGVVLSREKRHEAAEIEYREAVRLALEGAPNSAMAHCRLGEALAAQDRHVDAEVAFREAIRADPGLVVAHMGLGWALRQLGTRAEAEQEFRTGIALDASGAEGHLGLGSLLLDATRYPEAEAEFREAIRLAPSSAAAHGALGRLLASTGRHSEAAAEFRAVIGLQPGGDTVAEEALASLEPEIGDLTKTWGYRAVALRQRGRWRRHGQRDRPSARPGVRRRAGRGTWPPVGPDGRVHRRRDPATPAVLLRSPRARPLRRILAGFVDVVYIPMIVLPFTNRHGLWATVVALAVIYALNGYLEGRTGQSVGKRLGGLHTIRHATGEHTGGGKGAMRRLLHALDSPFLVGYVVGLASGRTFADWIMGTSVVWNPTWVTTTSAQEIAALERKDYKILKRRILRLTLIYLLLTWLIVDATDPDKPGRHSPKIIRWLWRLLFGKHWRRSAFEEE